MRAVAAGAALLLAAAAAAGPLEPYEVSTERGVTVRCGPSKIKKVPGQCAMLTVSPPAGKPWTAWANEDAPDTVRTLQRGEVLVVGDRELRIYTRSTRDKDSRTGALPPTARLLSALEMSERERLPRPGHLRSVKGLRADGDGHFIARVAQVRYADGEGDRVAATLDSIELRVAIDDGSVARVTPLPPLLPPHDERPVAKYGMSPNGIPPPGPMVAAPTAPAPPPPPPAERVLPETPPVAPGPPPERPTADPNFGQKGLKGYRPKGESSWGCSAVTGGPALALLALAALARRRVRR